MKLQIYDPYTTWYLLGGLIFMHLLMFGLSAFFIVHFLIQEGQIAAVIMPIEFIVLLLFLDITLVRNQLYGRLLLRCKVNEEGIFCRGFGCRPWMLSWSQIRVFAIVGYQLKNSLPFFVFSLDPQERFDQKRFLMLTPNRIVFSVTEENWNKLRPYMPADMKRNLQWSIEHERDCFHKR
ncbi:MAG: hypothetical protein PUC47_12340 [Oscillospiraceae bacterium]|nr:hypothetical protein [Oscillospiraceae bacterium]